jgi:hypothetical protein
MADHTPLAADATLRSVTATLDDKVGFIASAYAVINWYERKQGPVVLRLGVSRQSKGKRPNYCIDHAAEGGHVAVHIAAIDGNTHKPWPGNDINLSGDWSTKCMTYAEMAELLREVRN